MAITKRTRFRCFGTYNTERKAQEMLERYQKAHPQWSLYIKERTWSGKYKKRYSVMTVVRKGSKRCLSK